MINIKLIYIYAVNTNILSKLCDLHFDWFSVYWRIYWIINDNIEFWPEHRKLISVHNADLNVVLTTPASRCLSLLLEAFPDVVAQQDFFTRVWEEEGMRVPTNTLYQNISIIRRGFRAVGDTTHSLIATVPRIGFKIHNDINIQNHV